MDVKLNENDVIYKRYIMIWYILIMYKTSDFYVSNC